MARWQTITLAASLALNLVLIGFAAGNFLRHEPHPHMAPFGYGLARMVDALPAARSAVLRPLLQQSFAGLRPRLQALRETQRGIDRALAADPFDAKELTARLAEQRDNMNAAQLASHAALVQLTSQLSHEERLKLAAGLRAGSKRMRGMRMHAPPPDAP